MPLSSSHSFLRSVWDMYSPPESIINGFPDEYVVFITPTALQLSIFEKILNQNRLEDMINDSAIESLAMITLLTKICNSPILLKAVTDKEKARGSASASSSRSKMVYEAAKLLPSGAQPEDMSLSGMFRVTQPLDQVIRWTLCFREVNCLGDHASCSQEGNTTS